jgi:hypothetical protein
MHCSNAAGQILVSNIVKAYLGHQFDKPFLIWKF